MARGWLALAVALAAFVASFGPVGVVPASAALAAYGYDTADYTYDASAPLSSPDSVAKDARGSPSGPGAGSWVSSVSVGDDGVAANTGDALLSTASSGAGRSLPMNMETV